MYSLELTQARDLSKLFILSTILLIELIKEVVVSSTITCYKRRDNRVDIIVVSKIKDKLIFRQSMRTDVLLN